ncbi:MAG: hypothetical protein ACLTK0_08835 [Anaerovoracaceae bacterium]
MIYLGCHLTSSKGYENMAKEAVSINADTLQFFTKLEEEQSRDVSDISE